MYFISENTDLCSIEYLKSTVILFHLFIFVWRTASPVSLMKFSPDGEFFATAGQVSGFNQELLKIVSHVCIFIHIDTEILCVCKSYFASPSQVSCLLRL